MIFKSWSSRIISSLIGELFVLVISVHCFEQWTCIMMPKARGLAQHGGPPGRPEESDPAGVILNVMDGPYSPPFPYRNGCPNRGCLAASWRNFQLLLYSKCKQPPVMSYVTQGRHGLVL